jgi:hypothetical protein
MADTQNMTRRTFNRLHEELSLERDELYPRYELWLDVSEAGYDPETLAPAEAEAWCRDNGHSAIAQKMHKFDPAMDTPEDIMKRLFSA